MTHILPKLLLLLSVLLLVPCVGLAATDVPGSSGLPGTEERAPLRLMEEDDLRDEPQRPSSGARILAETGAGLVTSAGGGFLGLLVGSGLCSVGLVGSREGWLSCLDGAAAGALVGLGFGLSLGVWWGGEAAGGDGKLLGAIAGLISGTLVGSLVVVAGAYSLNSNSVLLAIPLFGLAGSIVGYELTERGESRLQQASRTRLQPVLAVSSHGAQLGLGGTF